MVRAAPAVESALPYRSRGPPGRGKLSWAAAAGPIVSYLPVWLRRAARGAGWSQPQPEPEVASLNESQSMFFQKGNHGLWGAGPGYIHVILSLANAKADTGSGARA